MPPRTRERRVWKFTAAFLSFLLLGAGIGWAIAVVFVPRPAVEESASTLVTVEEGSVESFQAVNVRAVWPRKPIAVNLAAGTVTRVMPIGTDLTAAGDTIYEVGLSPVVVVQGEVPAFRDMHQGISGDDVLQLQEFLVSKEYLEWFTPGVWESSTTWAVRAWQEDSGMTVDGELRQGELIFVPTLPAKIVVDSEIIRVGAQLSGGEEAVYQLDSIPSFVLPVTDSQAATIPLGSRVEISAPNNDVWSSWVTSYASASDDGGTDLILSSSIDGTDEEAICANNCGQVEVDPEGVLLRSRAITVEKVHGLVVPSAALTTTAQGKVMVIDENENEHEVTVIAGARGMTVIEGIDVGTRVRAPAERAQ